MLIYETVLHDIYNKYWYYLWYNTYIIYLLIENFLTSFKIISPNQLSSIQVDQYLSRAEELKLILKPDSPLILPEENSQESGRTKMGELRN